jgi:putative ABC transport system permease protein
MGAMSEKINLMVDGAINYFKTRVVVLPRAAVSGQLFGPPLSRSVVDLVMGVHGVEAATPTVSLLYAEETDKPPDLSLIFPLLIVGVEARFFDLERDRFPIELTIGRTFTEVDRSVVVIGIDIARAKGVRVGDFLKVRGRDFQIVGIMVQSLTIRDKMAFMPLREAQKLLAQVLPPMLYPDPYALATGIEVYPSKGISADILAQRINDRLEGIRATPPSQLVQHIRQNLIIFNVILMSNAIIAIFVGGLAILNTMMMAISERTKEIGIKKALGASRSDIAWEMVREAALIGLIGGTIGIAGGALVVFLLNHSTASEGIAIFIVTPRLVFFILVFSVVLGSAAGLYPALTAARSSPLECLRAE